MHKTKHAGLVALAVVVMLALAGASQAQDTGKEGKESENAESRNGVLYDVTITNLTRGQILSPPVVVSHRRSFSVFSSGEEASAELAALAEDADSAGLIALLGTEPRVYDVNIASGVILPGESITVQLRLRHGFRHVTALGMLVTTNDAFFSATRPVGFRRTFDAVAYDAGSEANTQECAHIPGPPCGNPGVRVTDGAEGFISVSSGIRAAGDLSVAAHDWRNPTARISVSRAY